MATKLQAADVARRAGVDVVIATGQIPEVIGRLAAGGGWGPCSRPWPLTAGRAQELDLAGPSARRGAGGSGAVAAMQGGLQPAAQRASRR